MENMIIGNVRLTVDPDSIALVDIKNNIVLPSSRDAGPNIIPTGSSDMSVQVGLVFPDEDDVNLKLRGLLALKRGLPLVNVKSEVLAAMYIASFGSEESAAAYNSRLDQIKANLIKEEQNAPDEMLRLLSDLIVRYYINQNIISAVGDGDAIAVVYDYLKANINIQDYLIITPARSATDSFSKISVKLYEPIIRNYALKKAGDKASQYNKIDFTKNKDEIVAAFFKVYSGDEHYSDTIRSGVFESSQTILFDGGTPAVVKDGDTFELTGGDTSYRVAGIDAYENQSLDEQKIGQNFYDRSALSYSTVIATKYDYIWNTLGTVTLLKFGQDAAEARTMVEVRLEDPAPVLSGNPGDIANALMVRKGHYWPMALQSNKFSTARDNIYIDAAKESSTANTGIWDPTTALPNYYNSGFTVVNEITGETVPTDTSGRKVMLPGDFRQAGNNAGYIAKIPISNIAGFPGLGGNPVLEFTLDLQVKGGTQTPTYIRAIKDSAMGGFSGFVNNYYYFMTRGSDIKTPTEFAALTGYINNPGNINPYKLNAVLGPALMKDFCTGAPITHLHLFYSFSDIAGKSSANIASNIQYKQSTIPSPWVSPNPYAGTITAYTKVVDSRLITLQAKAFPVLKEMLKSADFYIKQNNPSLSNDIYYTKLLNLFSDYIQRQKAIVAIKGASAKQDTVDGDVHKLIPIFHPDNWVPLAIESINVSTIPDRPKALYASIRFLPFDYSVYSPIFAYISSFPRDGSIVTDDPQNDKPQFDLAKTPIVENWLFNNYLNNADHNTNRVGPYTTEIYSSPNDFPELELIYSYPLTAFANYDTAVTGKTVKVYQDSRIRFYSRAKKDGDVQLNRIENVYNITLAAISFSETNNIKRIPLQSSMLPVVQHIGGGTVKFHMTLRTNDLNSIAQFRKVDSFINIMARKNVQDKLPVKVQIVHPMANLVGQKEYFITNTIISDTEGHQGWYDIEVDFIETSVNKLNESLEKIGVKQKLDDETKKDVATALARKLAMNPSNPNIAQSDNIWSLLVGPTRYMPAKNVAQDLAPMPFWLMYADSSSKIDYTINIIGVDKLQMVSVPTLNGNSISIINKLGSADISNILNSTGGNNYGVHLQLLKTNIHKNEDNPFDLNDFLSKINSIGDSNIKGSNQYMPFLKRTFSLLGKLLHIAPIITVKNNNRLIQAGSSNRSFLPANITALPSEEKSINHINHLLISGLGESVASVGDMFMLKDDKRIIDSYYVNPIKLVNLLLNRAYRKNGGGQFTQEDLTNTTTRDVYSEQGFWGHYIDSVNPDRALNQRIRIYRTEDFSMSSGSINLVYGVNLSRNNLPASIISLMSDLLYEFKYVLYKSKNIDNTSLDNDLVELFRVIINAMLTFEPYRDHIVNVINKYGDSDEDLAVLIPEIKNVQSNYKKLLLPTYNQIYGSRAQSPTDLTNITKILLNISSYGISIKDDTIRNFVKDLESKTGHGTKGVVENSLANPSRRKEYIRQILEIANELQLVAEEAYQDYENNVKIKAYYTPAEHSHAFNLIGELSQLIGELNKIDGYPTALAINTSYRLLPTYQMLGVPAVLNEFGAQDMNAPARGGNDQLEPGWQYFVPYPRPPDNRPLDPASLPSGGVKTADLSIDQTTHRVANAIIQKQIMYKEQSKLTPNKEQKAVTANSNVINKDEKVEKAINTGWTDALNDANKQLANVDDKKLKEIIAKLDKNEGLSIDKKIPLLKGDENTTIKPDKTKVNAFRENIHPSQKGFFDLYNIAAQRFTSNKVYDFRKMFPNVSLYFVRDINNPNAIFEDWAEYYKYDSIQYVAVTTGKEVVPTAVVRMTNITGLLSNEFNYDRANVSKLDIQVGDTATVQKSSAPNTFLNSDGQLTNKGTNNDDHAGDLLAFNLMPGTKIQIRMGYSSVDSENEIVFNGKVAEVRPGAYIEIVAQGYDYEAMRYLNQSWGGSYNCFPSIISDMLQNTSNFGHVEPFPFQENYYQQYLATLPENLTRKVNAVGYEQRSLFNNTTNDNLWGLKNDQSIDEWFRLDRFFNGQNWLCKGPMMDNIYSMRRYLSNYAVAVRPFDNRATMFFGPKDSLFIYTAQNKRDQIRFNELYKVLKENIDADPETYSSPYYEPLSTDKVKSIIVNADIGALSRNGGIQSLINKPISKFIGNQVELELVDMRDIASRVFYLFRYIVTGAPLREASAVESFARGFTGGFAGGSTRGITFGNDTGAVFYLEPMLINSAAQDKFDTSTESTSSIKSGITTYKDIYINNLFNESNIFHNIYVNNSLVNYHQNYGETLGGSMNKYLSKKTRATLADIGLVKTVSSIGFEDFSRELKNAIFSNGDEVLSNFTKPVNPIFNGINLTSNTNDVALRWKEFFRQVQQSDKKLSLIDAYRNVYSHMSNTDRLQPLIYYAISVATVDANGVGNNAILWAGYISFERLLQLNLPNNTNSINDDSNIRRFLLHDIYKLFANIDITKPKKAPTASKYSASRNQSPIPPDRKPFRMHHIIFDSMIVSNDISASTANMANRVDLSFPDDWNVKEDPNRIKDSDVTTIHVQYSPVLKDELAASAWDMNADFSSYGQAKAHQVGHEFLGDYLREMYQGSITILGNPSIWPYHTLYIQDSLKLMTGKVDVKTVTHIWDANMGFTTTIEPHLMVYVNEDTEADAIFWQNAANAVLIGGAFLVGAMLATGVAAAALVAIGATGGFAAIPIIAGALSFSGSSYIAGTALIGSANYFLNRRERGTEVPSFSLLGFTVPWPTSCGYSATFNANGDDISVRRNPCRIEPITYKGVPMVAGLEGYDRQWNQREVGDHIDSLIAIGRQAMLRDIRDYFGQVRVGIDKAIRFDPDKIDLNKQSR